MRKIWMAVALCSAMGAGFATAAPAQAQGWYGDDGGYHGGWYQDGPRQGYGNDWRVRAVCSGARANRLEDRLRRKVREGDIDRWQADRINDQIDRLENRQRRECAERDWRSIQGIADRYDRIDRWIASEARSRW